ncbi:MAG: DUF1501 domain-containing protein [Planctomycetales bacterium]|nr:DUF1501 domain-containing protein [Planctomycetales bacterium]
MTSPHSARHSRHSRSSRSTSFSRRQVLRAGLTGFSALTLPGLLRWRAEAALPEIRDTAVILVWLRGGASHLETFDPKPMAPAEYRGPYDPIRTRTVGMQVGELLPQLAEQSERYTLLRSVAHGAGGHPAGSLQVLGGDPDNADKPGPRHPDWMSVANFVRQQADAAGSAAPRALPRYVAVNPVDRYDSFQIAGPAFLGPGYAPFMVTGDPSSPSFEVPNLRIEDAQRRQLRRRTDLRGQLDQLRRDMDVTGQMDALDRYEQQALELLTNAEARRAFDLSQEPDAVRDRYGRHAWGQQCLMARRLVEAGVDIVATEFDGPLCGRVANWDDHAVNHHVFDAIKYRAPFVDQAVAALIEDVYQRGLDRRVLVVVTGEFGRTPRISYVASSGGGVASGPQGTVQPGRDHWPRANSMLFSGGGITTGQVIGATDRKGEDPIERRVGPGDFLATIYRHLGVDADSLAFTAFAGRNVARPLSGKPIPELCSTRH